MNPNEQEIERLLRHAPKPSPPAGLKERLLARASVAGANVLPPSVARSPAAGGWLRRWWPVLGPATVSLVCAVVLAVQQIEIRNLQGAIRNLSRNPAVTETVAALPPAPEMDDESFSENWAAKEQEEIERLKHRVAELTTEVAALEQVQRGNEELSTKLNAPPTLTQEELDALAKAKARALSINCINNLKQFGLAVRLWAQDNQDVYPPNSLSMSNELNTPKLLVCPADTNRVVAKSWAEFSTANSSYEYLTPSAPNGDSEPSRVLSRCPIHGHIGLCDGSVQGEAAKKHPEWFKIRDGKLYMER